ncbi:MAG TPA: tripartite tricarboxylate transporter TctB family protein [Methylomusa anaerophila]|uniref:Tripartite tricarboxylate transporter TctB family protein n=1 Tax=Methylomusa anaerophila TaxID=1930071 RepID=A0A348AJG7_9FIRM|nr:tripartite tricarboxylate transporter TctB family protein [Methylomusa anaerophila]BBB91215.1 tripartite tricarboxylate transporter TctB family protein [Methylomusa anaerophila]HML89790.1 tripartite tricarboxylate transporter TctB family protein [Methylomusa anaerophila]
MTEKALSIFFLLFSCTYLFLARELAFGTAAAPKTGFLPTLAGITAVILGMVITIRQLLQKQLAAIVINWRKLSFVIIGLLCYLILLKITGYIAATLFFMFYLFKVADTPGWILPGALAAVIAVGFYYVFTGLLDIQLP